MCKILVITGPLSRRQVRIALAQTNRVFQSQKDGFGFVATNGFTTARGRYLNPSQYAGYMQQLPKWLTGEQIEENKIPLNVNSLLIHGRTSTNIKNLANVHPFMSCGQYLIHNGVVSWQGDAKAKPNFPCDSEQLLQWLTSAGTWERTQEAWSGWGAIATLNSHNGVVSVLKTKDANLFIARRTKGQGWVMGTNAKDITSVCNRAEIGLNTSPLEFPAGMVVEFLGREILSDRAWGGFKARATWTQSDIIAYGSSGRKWVKKAGHGGCETRVEQVSVNGSEQLALTSDEGKTLADARTEWTQNSGLESFPDWNGKDI